MLKGDSKNGHYSQQLCSEVVLHFSQKRGVGILNQGMCCRGRPHILGTIFAGRPAASEDYIQRQAESEDREILEGLRKEANKRASACHQVPQKESNEGGASR